MSKSLLLFIPPLQITAADLSEFARPALFAGAALASVWVFHDARRRGGFGRLSACAWALLTLAFPPAVLPLYLAARLYTPPAAPAEEAADGEEADEATPPASGKGRAATLVYAAALALAGGLYFYVDYVSFDSRLARAERAKLNQRGAEAVAEYRAALRGRDDAHTRKLLALELLRAGRAEEALAELRAAGPGPPQERDDSLHFHTAEALDALGRRREAAAEYRLFLQSPSCAPPSREERCDAARARLSDPANREAFCNNP